MDLKDAHVVITGASRGIGAALADAFAARGARLTLAARSLPGLQEVAARTGGAVVQADLADPAVVDGFIARVEAEHGPVDVLVNNAGIDVTGAFTELSGEELERVIRLNAITVADLSRQVLPGMVERGRGHIVQMSSLAGSGVFPGMAVYAGTKAFVSHMTAGIRMELKGLPVGITLVESGLVAPTDMKDSVLSYPPTAACFRRFYAGRQDRPRGGARDASRAHAGPGVPVPVAHQRPAAHRGGHRRRNLASGLRRRVSARRPPRRARPARGRRAGTCRRRSGSASPRCGAPTGCR